MGLLSDRQIETELKDRITPFKPGRKPGEPKEPGVISSGVTSFGYDARLGYKFRVFKPYPCTVIDPKAFDARMLEEVDLTPPGGPVSPDHPDHILIPPHSFVLAETLETFDIPRDVLVVCVGKSTLARCFSGGTRVRLVDGTTPTFRELVERNAAGETLYGYGYHETQGYVVQPLIEPRRIGREKTVIVTLDNGEKIRCTPDHRFLLRSGGTKRAGKLKEGDRLMPLYLHDSHGYETVWNPITRKWRQTHLLVEDMMIRLGRWRPRPANWDIHHKKGRRNNHPKNLKRLHESDHGRLHSNERDMSALSKEYWADPVKKELHLRKLHAKEVQEKAAASRSRFYATEEGKRSSTERLKNAWRTRGEEGRRKQSELLRSLKLRHDITEDAVREALATAGTLRGAARLLKTDRCVFRRFPKVIAEFKRQNRDEALKAAPNNHKVASVEKEKGERDVYCLTAPETGNFALAAGVIVNNCSLVVNVTPLEPEWKGKVTVEISNTAPLPAKLYPGEGIMQCLFFRSDERRNTLENGVLTYLDRMRDAAGHYYPAAVAGNTYSALTAALDGAGCGVSYADKSGKYQAQTGLTLPFVEGDRK